MARENLNLETDKTPSSDSISPQSTKNRQGLWVLWVVYVYILLLSPPDQIIGGEPVWAIQPHTIQEALNESTNYFFILPIVNALGIKVMIAPWVHPVSQALFNVAEAWMLMFLPLMLADPQGEKLPKVSLWGLAMFLTNVFLIPYMALRTPLRTSDKYLSENNQLLRRVLGWIGVIVGCSSIVWGCIAFPEVGNLAQRGPYLLELLTSDRLTIAFAVDLALFWIFQVILLETVIPGDRQFRWLRFIPFGGLAVWLIL